MRVSVDSDDRGYTRHTYGYQVFLDGDEIKNCIMADEEKGCAKVFVTDENGKLLENEDRTEFMTKTLYGHIIIIPPPWTTLMKQRFEYACYRIGALRIRLDYAWLRWKQKISKALIDP